MTHTACQAPLALAALATDPERTITPLAVSSVKRSGTYDVTSVSYALMESARLPQVRLQGVRLLAGLLRSHFLETRSDRCSCKTAFHPTSDLYLIKVAVMAPTTARTVKNTRKPYPPTTISNGLWLKQG